MNLIDIILWPLEKYARLCGWKKEYFDFDYDDSYLVHEDEEIIDYDSAAGNASSTTVTQPYIEYRFDHSPDRKLEQVREKLDTLYLIAKRQRNHSAAEDVLNIIDFIDK